MSQTTITLALLAGAAVAAIALLRAWPEIRREWSLGSWLAFWLGWLPSLGTAYAAVTGAKVLTRNDLGDLELMSAQEELMANVGKALLLVLAGWVVLRRTRGDSIVHLGPVIVGGIVAVSMVTNFDAGGAKYENELLILLALLAASVVAPRGRPVALGFALFGISVAIVSALVTAVSFETTVAPCERKCGALGVLYFGVFNNENQLGVVLLCTLPFVWLAVEGRRRVVLSLYMIGLVAVTGNRTSAVVALALLLAFAFFQPRYAADGATGKRGPLLAAAVGLTAVASIVIPLTNDLNLAYTGRGRLWLRALDLWFEHFWFGDGYGAWQRQQQGTSFDFVGDYSPHNLWLDLAVATGVVGMLLFVAAIVAVWRLRAPGGGYVLGIVLLTLFALGTLEQPLTFFGINSFTYTLFGLLLAVPARATPLRTIAPRDQARAQTPLRTD